MTVRTTRTWLARGALLLVLLAPFLVRFVDFGDRGMRNAFTGLLLGLALLGLTLFFATRRGIPRGVRLGVLGGLALVLALGQALVRVEGFDGELVPQLAWRAAAPVPEDARPASAGAGLRLGSPSPADWAGFLGPHRDNEVRGLVLDPDWDARPPRLLWRGPIGSGWSAFAVAGGFAFTLEQDATGQRASARVAASGALVWSVRLDERFEHVLGGDGPRATPTVELDGQGGGRLWVLSARGSLACLDAADGALVWEHDLVAEFGADRAREAEHAPYGRSSSPLVAGELLLVPAGGRAGLVAFEKHTGQERWASPARHFSCSSPSLALLAGVEQVLSVNEASVSGHALADGRILWEHPWPGRTDADPNVSQPVPVGADRLLLSKGYGAGGLCLALEARADGTLGARELWRAPRLLRTKFTSPALRGGVAYALDDGMLECVNLARGEKRWKEGRYGHGQLLLVGAHLLVCAEDGELSLLAPAPEHAPVVLGRVQALEGKCWAHLALAGNVLFLRNAGECAAWELPGEP